MKANDRYAVFRGNVIRSRKENWSGRRDSIGNIHIREDKRLVCFLRRSVSAHRFLTSKGRGRREMKAILLRAGEEFAKECTAKGGYLEPHSSNFYSLTHANIRPRTSLNTFEICMRSSSQSLGAFLTETSKNTYDYADEDSHSIVTFHPTVVVTQQTLDAQAQYEANAKRKREEEFAQERIDVERWRLTIKPGTETGCGPVLRVNGDLIEVAYYQTREPKWFRRAELSPGLYNKAGLRTCN